jgi:hypothetical protein
MSVEAFPLQWPEHRPRTERYHRETARFDVSFARARDNIVHEVTLLCGRYGSDPNIVISTNIALRRDGLPLANQRNPDDPGVAVYFVYRKKQMSFACDRWLKIEHNMQAIAKTIEALRGIDRWSTGHMLEAAFTGFTALPPMSNTQAPPRPWWTVLGVSHLASTQEIRDAFRRAASLHHPDKRGGSHERMAELNRAYEEAGGSSI